MSGSETCCRLKAHPTAMTLALSVQAGPHPLLLEDGCSVYRVHIRGFSIFHPPQSGGRAVGVHSSPEEPLGFG